MNDKIIMNGFDVSECPNIQLTVGGNWMCFRKGFLPNWFSCESFENCPYKTIVLKELNDGE